MSEQVRDSRIRARSPALIVIITFGTEERKAARGALMRARAQARGSGSLGARQTLSHKTIDSIMLEEVCPILVPSLGLEWPSE